MYTVPRDKHDVLVQQAKLFRKQPTRSEWLLWQALRRRSLGARFRRQGVLGPFVVDFLAPSHRLVVEVDGPVHEKQAAADLERQQYLERWGYRFVRLPAGLVEGDLPAALSLILQALRETPSRTLH